MSTTYITENGVTKKIQKLYDVESGLTKKIKKLYKVENGITQLHFSDVEAVQYTGNFTITDVMIGSVPYELYTLTSSGTLTILKDAQYWICGGGGGGIKCLLNFGVLYGGGGGAGAFTKSGNITMGAYVVSIASGGASDSNGGTTYIYDASGTTVLYSANGGQKPNTPYSISGGNGGCGGGGGSDLSDGGAYTSGSVGTGDGKAKLPFGITELFKHCAGGGAGTKRLSYTRYASAQSVVGGNGGTNGSNGTKCTHIAGSATASVGTGGERGGGNGGSYSSRNGKAASYYGSGGGGGGGHIDSNQNYLIGTGGKGYQGVAYLLIPA